MAPKSFDFLARHYNAMTGFPGRIDGLARQISPWIEDWKPKEVLDAGCGGGVLMLALDRHGVTPTGLDASEPMLRLALANCRAHQRRFRFCGTSYEMAGRLFPSRFDAVITVGNSIIGAQSDAEMTAWLTGLRDAIKPGGHFLIQILNLTPFILGLKTVIARRNFEGGEFVRAALPDGDRVNFCAIYLLGDGEVRLNLSRWIPWEHKRLSACAAAADFRNIRIYGSLDRTPFNERTSVDLVLSADCE